MRDSDRITPENDDPAHWGAAAFGVSDSQGSTSESENPAPFNEVPSGDLVAEVIARIAKQTTLMATQSTGQVPSDRIDALCDALISTEPDAALQLIRQVEAEGASPDTLCLDYIAAAARRMGERWVADCASFLDVTMAGGRLMGLVRDLAISFVGPEEAPLPGHAILIATVPGETHSLGAAIAAECFRRAQWDVTLLDGADADEIVAHVASGQFPVVGLSAGSRRMVPVLAETVRAVRRADPEAVICIGGPILTLEPEIVRTVGADHAAADPSAICVLLRRQIACQSLGAGFQHAET